VFISCLFDHIDFMVSGFRRRP